MSTPRGCNSSLPRAFVVLSLCLLAGAARGAEKLPGVGLDYFPGKPDPFAGAAFNRDAFIARYGEGPEMRQYWPGMVAELFFVNATALRTACLAGALGNPAVYDCVPKKVEQHDLAKATPRPYFIHGEPGETVVYRPNNFYCKWWVNQGPLAGRTPENPIAAARADKPAGLFHEPPATGWSCPVYYFNTPPATVPTCQPGDTTLCLGGGRFAVTVEHSSPVTPTGPGHAVPLTADTGAFWFFGDDNLELMVKVLDGCLVTHHYWVFAAGLTDVGVRIRVRDTQTGGEQVYESPQGTPFQPVQDTLAFPACG